MVANHSSKIFAMVRVDESTTDLDWNGPTLPGVVLYVAPSVTLTKIIVSLHQNLRERSIEWVAKKPGKKENEARKVNSMTLVNGTMTLFVKY